MGIFGKLKNILFEDDDELEDIPVYTKEEVEEVQEEVKVEPIAPKVEEKPVEQPTRFRNVKRDIDLDFEEDDILGEVPGAFETTPVAPKVEEPVQPEPVVELPKVEEKKSIFPSFDEAEFERLNSRINHNESKATQREVVKRVDVPQNDAAFTRQANNNFSSTTVNEENLDPDRYKINTGTIVNGKKPFTPSPVISPVYGILDKNYTKDDIVDRKGGMKRDTSAKKPAKKEITIEEAEEELQHQEVTFDTIRKKAYGEDIELPEEKKKVEDKPTKPSEEVYKEVEEEEEVVITPPEEKYEEVKEETPSIEDQIEEENFEVDDTDKELDSVVEEVVPEAKAEKVEKKKMKVLDDLEKTSTLKILDDIEKELNSIKPISKEEEAKEDADIEEEKKNLDNTLENDLFNLIDSMYEEGDEDDD